MPAFDYRCRQRTTVAVQYCEFGGKVLPASGLTQRSLRPGGARSASGAPQRGFTRPLTETYSRRRAVTASRTTSAGERRRRSGTACSRRGCRDSTLNAFIRSWRWPAHIVTPRSEPERGRPEARPPACWRLARRALCATLICLREAREAVAASYATRGVAVAPDRVVLCASTSEAYAWLLKLLCDPGNAVLAPRPSYPLFEHLAALEGVRALPTRCAPAGRHGSDATRRRSHGAPSSSSACTTRRRACAAMRRSPPSPPIIADEVFADYGVVRRW